MRDNDRSFAEIYLTVNQVKGLEALLVLTRPLILSEIKSPLIRFKRLLNIVLPVGSI